MRTPEEKFYDEMVERKTIELGDMWSFAAAAIGHHLELKLDREHPNASAEWRQGFKRALLYLKAEE